MNDRDDRSSISIASVSFFTDVHRHPCDPKARTLDKGAWRTDRNTLRLRPTTKSRTRRGPTHHKRKRRRRRQRQQRSNSSTSRQSFDYIFNWTAAGLDVCGCVHGPRRRRITELRPPRVAPLRRRRHRHLPTSVISQPWSGGPLPASEIFFFFAKCPSEYQTIQTPCNLQCFVFTYFSMFTT